MKTTGIILLALLGFVALGALGVVCSYVDEAASVAREEFGPRNLFERYQKFKDLAAALDSMQADIEMYQERVEVLSGTPRSQLDRSDKEELAQVRAELIGVRAKYNRMAAEYNAAMAKINYRFANVGMLPEGADEVLPREFRRYEK